jgi:hypothetical protein
MDYHPQNPIPVDLGSAPLYSVYRGTKFRGKKGALAIATMYTPEIAELGYLTSQAIKAYAQRHGYTAVIAASRLDLSRHAVWSKLVLVEHYLSGHPSCKWMMWIDADAVITNPEKRFEDFLTRDIDFLVAEDLISPINVGVFLIRNIAATIALLRRAYSKTHYLAHPLPEQMALAEALRESGDAVRTRIVSRRLFNSFAMEYQVGDFIIHFAGCTREAKLAGVKKAIRDSDGGGS